MDNSVRNVVILGSGCSGLTAAIYAAREFVDAGGLIGYGVSYPDLYHRAASFVDKVRFAEVPTFFATRWAADRNTRDSIDGAATHRRERR